MESVLTCVLPLVVSTFTIHSREFEEKYPCLPHNLTIDSTNLSNKNVYDYKS